jgi:hypothetical protein
MDPFDVLDTFSILSMSTVNSPLLCSVTLFQILVVPAGVASRSLAYMLKIDPLGNNIVMRYNSQPFLLCLLWHQLIASSAQTFSLRHLL